VELQALQRRPAKSWHRPRKQLRPARASRPPRPTKHIPRRSPWKVSPQKSPPTRFPPIRIHLPRRQPNPPLPRPLSHLAEPISRKSLKTPGARRYFLESRRLYSWSAQSISAGHSCTTVFPPLLPRKRHPHQPRLLRPHNPHRFGLQQLLPRHLRRACRPLRLNRKRQIPGRPLAALPATTPTMTVQTHPLPIPSLLPLRLQPRLRRRQRPLRRQRPHRPPIPLLRRTRSRLLRRPLLRQSFSRTVPQNPPPSCPRLILPPPAWLALLPPVPMETYPI